MATVVRCNAEMTVARVTLHLVAMRMCGGALRMTTAMVESANRGTSATVVVTM